jgi:hypothetical protein
MAPKVPLPVTVRGGSNGVEAHYDDIVATARVFGKVATDTAGAALTMHRYLVDPGVYSGALFDPAGVAAFEADLLEALDGYHGLSAIAARCALIDTELRAAATAYQQADRLGTTLHDRVAGVAHAGPSALRALNLLARSGNVSGSLQSVLTRDPALVDELMNSGLLALDGLVAPLYADGHPRLTDRGIDASTLARTPPRNLADLVAGLSLRNAGAAGEVDVRIMTGADGRRRAIVDIPGTKTFDPTAVADITGPATNVRALVGVRRPTRKSCCRRCTGPGCAPPTT